MDPVLQHHWMKEPMATERKVCSFHVLIPSERDFFFKFGINYNVVFHIYSKVIQLGVPVVAQWLTNPTRNHEVVGSIPGLAQWVKDLTLP